MNNRIFDFKNYKLIDQRRQLALLVEHFTDKDGFQSTAIPSLDFIRASNISIFKGKTYIL